MVDTIKRLLLFGAWVPCLCCILPCLTAQSALLSVASVTPSINDSLENLALHSVDGPYLFREENGSKILTVIQSTNRYQLLEEFVEIDEHTTLTCMVDNDEKDLFTIPIIDKITPPKSTYKQPEKLLAISDIEGNFNSMYSLLVANGVMDEAFNWTFGKGHLVLNGDFMDRGKNVTQVLWLIYRLEQLAEEKGGMVHFILGNHEVLNLEGKSNYVDEKYIKLAQKYTKNADGKEAYIALMSENQELVKWMKSKNVIEKIGNTLFVHGGISPQLVNTRFNLDKINRIARNRLNNGRSLNESDRMDEDFLFASHGPLWFRGLAIPYRNYYKKSTDKQVYKALRFYKVDHISIGHTIASEVSLDFNGRVIRTDVKHPTSKNSDKSQGLLIEDGVLYRVDGKGKQVRLK